MCRTNFNRTQTTKKDTAFQQIQQAKRRIEDGEENKKHLENSIKELNSEIEGVQQRIEFHKLELEIAEDSYKAILMSEGKENL